MLLAHLMFSLLHAWNQPVLQGVMVPFSGKWYLENKIWALDVLIATECHYFRSSVLNLLNLRCLVDIQWDCQFGSYILWIYSLAGELGMKISNLWVIGIKVIYKAKTLEEISSGLNINSEEDQRLGPRVLQYQDEGEEEELANKTEKKQPVR